MKLTWGLLAAGNIAGQFATGILNSARGTLAAVGSRSAASAATFASTYNIPHAHASYDALLADPSVDAVYISLPNSMHHEWTLKALAAGKHVLCEKPMASNLAQVREMFAAARKANRILAEAFMYRSHPQTHAIQKTIADGAIGKVKVIRSSFTFAASQIEGNIRFDPALHGGSLMDVGCYCLNFSRLIAGAEPTAMSIHAHIHDRGIDDYAAGILAFPDNILANFACGTTVQGNNTAFIQGTTGYLEIPEPWKPPAQNATFTIHTPAGKQTQTISANRHLYALEADDFAATVIDHTPPRVSETETLGNQACLDTLRKQMGLAY